MRLNITIKCLMSAGVLLASQAFLHSAPLIDRWTFAGGGLNPATYGGNFRPTPLNPDALSNNGATIVATGLVVEPFGSGGLGSTSAGAYGGIYTFFAENSSYFLSTSTILNDLDTITISFLAGGGSPSLVSYNTSSLTLNYNGANPALASNGFGTVSGIIVDSPIGEQDLTEYTWTWTGLSALGATTGFSTSWNTQGNEHVFFTDFTLTQAVPEPSTIGLIVIGGAFCALRRRRR